MRASLLSFSSKTPSQGQHFLLKKDLSNQPEDAVWTHSVIHTAGGTLQQSHRLKIWAEISLECNNRTSHNNHGKRKCVTAVHKS